MNVTENMYQYRYEREKVKTLETCKMCGYKVHEGEYFYLLGDEYICDECILDYLKQYRKVAEQ